MDIGPNDERFTSVLLGVRGSGKTVALTEIEGRLMARGWVVLSVDASTKGLLGRISQAIQQASEEYESLELSDLRGRRVTGRSKSVKLGPYQQSWSDQETVDPYQDMGVRQQLGLLAAEVQQTGGSVLLTVDELHSADRDEARRLANDIQHITKRSGLPLAFLGAGLLSMRYTVMQDSKITFFQRCNRYEMPPLSLTDALKGLRVPILDAGGMITDGALRTAAGSVGDLPYKLQVLGHSAWDVAGAPQREIDEYAVGHAIEIAGQKVDENISEPAFFDLSDSERDYLAALVELGGEGTIRAVASRAGMNIKTARKVGRRLDLSGYARRHDDGTFTLTGLVSAKMIAREAYIDQPSPGDDTVQGSSGSSPARGIVSAKKTACRQWMPRAKSYCVLSVGHSGGCRSR